MAGESRKDTVFNLLIAGALLYVLTLPQSPARRAFDRWMAQRQEAAAIDDNWSALEATTSRLGSGSGELALVEFADYQCPFCGDAHPVVETYLKANPDARIGYRHLPLDFHERARSAALTAICAEFQGRFKEAHQLLFEIIDNGPEPDWAGLGSTIGVPDTEEFAGCLSGVAARERLEEDMALAEALGVAATPSFVSRDRIHPGAPPHAEALSAMIGEARDR